ncbi:MAG: hypothetical protein WAM97_13965, partial [Acidimicrobiales bacterium]
MTHFDEINQFHPGTALGDAITQQMLHLQEHLRALGYRSEIFAEHIAAGLEDRIRPVRSYKGSEKNLLLVHHSLGSEYFEEVIDLPDAVVAVYHNVTPECYFKDEIFRHFIRLGRDQLNLLARRALVGVAASNYNRREMLQAGFWRPEVLPVRTDYSAFSRVGAKRETWTTDWLYVGRIVGNKCQH